VRQDNLPGARAEFQKALELNPQLPAAFFHLGVLQFEQSNSNRPKNIWRAPSHSIRKIYLAQNFLGRSLRETGNYRTPSPLSSLHSSFGRLNRTF